MPPICKSYPSLSAVCHAAVKSCPVDARTVADLLGKPYATLMSELSGQPGHKFGADLLLPLMDVAGTDAPLHFLARQRGGVYLSITEPAAGGSELAASLAVTVREYSEFLNECAASIADGDIPSDQLTRMNKEGQEAIEAIMAMLKLARITHEAQYGRKANAGA